MRQQPPVQPTTWLQLLPTWPVPEASSDKYSRGVVGLHSGSATYPGAALLGCAGALYGGAGMVRYLGDAPRDLIVGTYPSVVTAPGRVQVHVVGSGWGDRSDARELLDSLGHQVPWVVDADAIALVPHLELPQGSLLTPHAGELARLMGVQRRTVETDPARYAWQAATRWHTTVLLKGSTQYVTNGEGLYATEPGPAWTAQAGSGDVLAGLCGAVMAAGVQASRAALLAASLQAQTATTFPGPIPPDKLAEHFPAVLTRRV